MSDRLFAVAALVVAIIPLGPAHAQRPLPVAPGVDLSIGQGNYNGQSTFNVRQMDFDLWCQQTQRYEITRCVARRAYRRSYYHY